jgi:hypothetical protein
MQNLRNKLIVSGAVLVLAAIGAVMNRQSAAQISASNKRQLHGHAALKIAAVAFSDEDCEFLRRSRCLGPKKSRILSR